MANGNISGTPLHYASWNGHLSIVEYLIKQKADINILARGFQPGTPLHYASWKGHLGIVQLLVNQKAEINAKVNNVEY